VFPQSACVGWAVRKFFENKKKFGKNKISNIFKNDDLGTVTNPPGLMQ